MSFNVEAPSLIVLHDWWGVVVAAPVVHGIMSTGRKFRGGILDISSLESSVHSSVRKPLQAKVKVRMLQISDGFITDTLEKYFNCTHTVLTCNFFPINCWNGLDPFPDSVSSGVEKIRRSDWWLCSLTNFTGMSVLVFNVDGQPRLCYVQGQPVCFFFLVY